jgi:uncharacterized protein YfaS (alpha-2-macroglobulin family)
MALGKDPSASEFTRCFALLVSSLSVEHRDVLEPVARDLYARRARFSEEMRAFLAVAMHRLGILEEQREQLLREIDHPLTVSFDPRSFASLGRTEGVRAWAFATLHPGESDGKTRLQLQHRISQMLEDSPSLSTQENFWLLLAFRELHAAVLKSRQSLPSFAPKPDQVSRNGLSARWNALRMSEVRRFSPGPDAGSLLGLSVMWEAQFRMAEKEPETALNRGLRVERVVKNRTHTGRTGSKEHPFKLGDELEITFRLISPRDHHYVALEAELPACFESVRHKKSHVADAADARVGEEGRELEVSFFEARDKSVCLFFDRVMPGLGVASTVVRVTSVGTFTWPPAQVAPMYDSRFSAVSAGSLCEVTD